MTFDQKQLDFLPHENKCYKRIDNSIVFTWN